ncbi:MAG: PAS domain S-box protein [Mycobacterium sp.]|nr:PAS domain S-box protein [Mycobacterium sp.]
MSGDIVVVDDEPGTLKLLKNLLEADGYDVRAFTGGSLALRSIDAKTPDLVMLDIRMPGLSGFEVCEQLKANPASKDVPVMFLSGVTDIEDKVKAFEAGGVDYITKPFERAEVLARVGTHVSLFRALEEVSSLTEELRRRQLEEYQSLSEAVPVMVYRTSPDMSRFFYVSPSVEGLFGVTAAEVVADADLIRSRVHPDDADRVRQGQQACGAAGDICELDYRIVGRDGSQRFVRDMNRVVAGEAGKGGYRIGTVVDVTDLHVALEDAERLRAHFEAIFTNNDMPMATLDSSGGFLDVNAPMLSLLGTERGQIVGRDIGGFVHEGDRELEAALLVQAATNPGVGAHQLIRFVRPDGSVSYGQQRLVVLPPGDLVAGMQLVAITDLTDLEFATRAVRRHQRQLAGLFGNSPAPMVMIGTDGVFRRCNSAFCQLVEYREEELVGWPCSKITHPDDVDQDRALMEELLQGKCANFMRTKRLITRSGATVRVRNFATRVPSADEEGQEVIAQIMVDVTGDSGTGSGRG